MSRSGSSTVRCIACGEPIDEDARLCPHCGELQPSPILAAGLVTLGVFGFLLGFLLAAFTVGLTRWVGFGATIVGLGLAFGGYTSYLDAKAQRRRRAR